MTFTDKREGWVIHRDDGAFYQSSLKVGGKIVRVDWTESPLKAQTWARATLCARLLEEIRDYEKSPKNLTRPVPARLRMLKVETKCELSE